MQALWITLGALAGLLLLVVLLLLVGKARIRIVCKKKPKVIVSVFGIRFPLYSGETGEKDAARDLSRCRNPQRALKKELRRQRKEAKKAQKKQEKARQKALQKAAKKKQKQLEKASGLPAPSIMDNLTLITGLIRRLYDLTNGKIRIRVRRMHLAIATGDAAKTAVAYGIVVQMAAYLLQFIQARFVAIERKPGAMEIRADYLAQKSHMEVDIECSVRLISALKIGLCMLSAYRKENALAQRRAKERHAQAKGKCTA